MSRSSILKPPKRSFAALYFSCTIAVMLSAMAGCESRPTKADLGTVVFDLPKLPDDDKPVALPFLDSSSPPTSPKDR